MWRYSRCRFSEAASYVPRCPAWLKVVALAGMGASAVALLIAVYPVVDVVSRASYAAKISGVVVLTNIAGVALYRAGKRRAQCAA